MGPAGPAIDGPAEKLVNELQQSRKMQMIDHLQAKLLEDQRRSLKHFECVQSGLSIMRAGAMRSRPQTSPAGGIVKQTAQELGLQRLSFTETLRQEVEASRVSCGIRGSVELPSHVPSLGEKEGPKCDPAKKTRFIPPPSVKPW
ncbi:unnamed protein product [Durusdinium trenchii]|uniref:Uncharacterized protein n=1 Tax=Durusdinium trenchii TaxID=1381693 RepID=A0ABP0ICT6_9DINO